MSLNDKLQYWDTCIFLAWIKGENRASKEETNGWKILIDHLEKGNLQVLTSSVTLAELHYAKFSSNFSDLQLAKELEEKLFKALKHSFFRICPVDQQTGMVAKELRNYFIENTTQHGIKGTISLADSIHLATAIQMQATVFQTFDKKELKGGNLGLASLNGDSGVKGLKIEVPSAQDYELPKRQGNIKVTEALI